MTSSQALSRNAEREPSRRPSPPAIASLLLLEAAGHRAVSFSVGQKKAQVGGANVSVRAGQIPRLTAFYGAVHRSSACGEIVCLQ
eukprot:3417375-Pleurochrysis_carterae.AAC.6